MKCKYKFKVDGEFRPKTCAPISARGYEWEFLLDDGIVTHLAVTVPLTDVSQWPSITKMPNGLVKANVNPNLVHLPFIQHELRSIQGLLCMFGLRSINPSDVDVEWLPDSPAEKEKLSMYRFSIGSGRPDPSQIPEITFDLLARAIISEPISAEAEVPLNFFRRARQAMYEREYIQAIYSFFFVLETLFGDGKFKKAALIKEFGSAETLVAAIAEGIQQCPPLSDDERHLRLQFDSKFKGMSVNKYIEHIVDLRGYLHHHTLRRSGGWDPNKQHDFLLDCIILSQITFKVLFGLAWEYMDKPCVVEEYKRQISTHLGIGWR